MLQKELWPGSLAQWEGSGIEYQETWVNRDTDVENKLMDTKAGEKSGGGAGGMNWEIGIDIYTPICIQ